MYPIKLPMNNNKSIKKLPMREAQCCFQPDMKAWLEKEGWYDCFRS